MVLCVSVELWCCNIVNIRGNRVKDLKSSFLSEGKESSDETDLVPTSLGFSVKWRITDQDGPKSFESPVHRPLYISFRKYHVTGNRS